jgi:hypothetical protein
LPPVFGEIGLGVEAANGSAGDRGEASGAGFVAVDAGWLADGVLREFRERGIEGLLGPANFLGRGMAIRGEVGED